MTEKKSTGKAGSDEQATKAEAPASSGRKSTSKKAVRYSDEQRREILEFVENYDKEHGRGGQTAAAEKFGVTPLTISNWRKKSGKKPRGRRKAKTAGEGGARKQDETTKADRSGSEPESALERMLAIREKLDALRGEYDSLKAKL